MTLGAGFVLILLVVALVLFGTNRLRIDVTALMLILLLTIPSRWIDGLLTTDEVLAGLGSDTIVLLGSLFVLTAGMVRTGVVERIGLRLASLGSKRPLAFSRFILIAAAAISAFVSNTLTTAVFLPLVIGASARAKLPASKLLMPLAFASILTGTMTLIGTSTNLVVAGQMPGLGMPPLGFFELAKLGAPVAVVGMLYLLFVAPRWIPDRGGGETEKARPSRRFMSEVVVTKRSPLAGKTLAQLRLGDVMDLIVVSVRRGYRVLRRFSTERLREGDEIVVEGNAPNILSVKDLAGIEIKPEVNLSNPADPAPGMRIAEAMVLPRSPLVGQSLRESRFLETTGLTVLGIHAAGGDERVERLSNWQLSPSDVLLLQGHEAAFDHLPHDLLLLEDFSAHHPRTPKGTIAATIFVLSIAIGASGLLPLAIAILLGVLGLLLTKCLTPEDAYAAIDWRLLVMIAAMLAFGAAMAKSGAASWLASLVVDHIGPLGGRAVLASFFLLTLGLSIPMSNQAAALIVLPVAVRAAHQLGLDPRALVIAVTFAASCSFLTPLEPACLLVYGPGRYRFSDYMKVGFPLTVLVLLISMFLLPVFWPLQLGQ